MHTNPIPSSAAPDAGADMALPPATAAITPFRAAIPQERLVELKRRLSITRWPEHEAPDWAQGVPPRHLRELVQYWRSRHDWRRVEAKLNALPQFRTQLDGLGIHFIHVRSRHRDALPVVLTHGWPGSVLEFLDVIGPLTDPTAHGGVATDAFDVIIPSLPGFGFSDKPADAGWDLTRIAGAWARLMERLGYRRWVAQGGDWGAGVATVLAHLRPPGLAGIHLNWPFVIPTPLPATGLSPDEQRAADAVARFLADGHGYYLAQALRPQTIGTMLAATPAGLAAWIYEKFHAWCDHDGDIYALLGRDALLDNISLYWLTNTAASSARIYWENWPTAFYGGRLELPVAVSIFPKEIYRAPRSWGEACFPQLIYWNEVERGGHFAALEQPALFVRELRAGLAALR